MDLTRRALRDEPSAVKFRYRAPAIILGAVILVIVAITALAQALTSQMVQTAHEGDYDLMRKAFASTLKAMTDEATSDAEIVASIPTVRAAFAKRDRAALQAETLGIFQTIEPKYAVDQAQFHVPPGVSFLRLHDPARFDDDQRSYRPMLAEAHAEKSIRKGVDITRVGPAIFGIVPILEKDGQLVGTFEMGLEFGPVLDDLKTAYGLEGAVFFEAKQLRQIATEIDPAIMASKNRVGKYVRYHATHPDLMGELVTDRDVETTQPKNVERTAAGVAWGVQMIPLYNYANKQIGVVALAMSFEEDKTVARRAIVWQVLAGVFGVVLLAGIVLIVIRGVLLVPLAHLTDRMTALAEGDATKPADPLDDHCDELRNLADAYERLRRQKQS